MCLRKNTQRWEELQVPFVDEEIFGIVCCYYASLIWFIKMKLVCERYNIVV